MEDEFGFEDIYPEKMTVYIYYLDENNQDKNGDVESILEMEEIKKYFDELIKINVEYESICLRNNNIQQIFEKIYYSNPYNFIILYNAKFEIVDISYTFSKIYKVIKTVPINFDIIFFGDSNDSNKIVEWVDGKLPNFAIIRKDSLYKFINKNYENIQIYYSNENIKKGFIENLQESVFNIYQSVADWINS